MFHRLAQTLEFIKFSHTVFALPFALSSMLVAANGWPAWSIVGLILLCMISARTAAMAFNRYVDWEWDLANPRTAHRSQLATKTTALTLCLVSILVFIAGTWYLNRLCFALSPIALLLILGYSLTKRFTPFSHAFLGLALSAAPMGAWAAVRGELWSLTPYCLAAAVWCWVFGFDLIYATQDVAFDRRAGLHSFPAKYGIPQTLLLAQLLHGLTWLILALFGWLIAAGWAYGLGLIVAGGALIYEHRLSRTGDLSKMNIAFFQVNAVVSFALLIGVGMNIWMPS